jgi:hypothetical protein
MSAVVSSVLDAAALGGARDGCVSDSLYLVPDMQRDKQYVIFPSDRASARVQARRLAMLEFGVRRPDGVNIVDTERFQDRRGSTGYTVWVRVG